MALSVRMMIASEIDLICDYFENATTEHLETLGVDPPDAVAKQSRRLLIADMSSKEAALWAASIIASVGFASGCNAAAANRRYLAGSA